MIDFIERSEASSHCLPMLATVEFRKDYHAVMYAFLPSYEQLFSQDAHREIRPLIHE